MFLFPGAVLIHLVGIYGAWPASAKPSLVGAAILLVAGLAFRFVRRASLVLAVGSIFSWLFLVYVLGIAPTIAYLSLSHREQLLPWVPATSVVVMLSFLAYRVREDSRTEFSLPVDQSAGIVVSKEDGALWRERPKRADRRLSLAATAMLATFGPALFLTWGTPRYVFILFVLGGHCLALLTTVGVARWVAYYIAVRRWETRHKVRLRIPKLNSET